MNRHVLMVGLLVLAACSGTAAPTANVISTLNTVGVGEQRILVELRDGAGQLVALDAPPVATLRDENGSPQDESEGELLWIVPDEQPAYAFYLDVPFAETFQLTVDAGDLGESRPAGFVAVEDPIQVLAGEQALPISGPDIAGPALVVFATPEWCPSRSCQPMIDQAQAAVSPIEGVGFVQVDVFENPDVGNEDDLLLAPDVDLWGIPSQPWLYAVDSAGRVAAVFEGAVSDRELSAAVDAIEG